MSVTIDASELSRLMNLLGDSDGDLCFWLPLGETMGAGADIQDSSSRGLHGTNPVAADNPSVIRGGLMSRRFNGVDEYMEIADNVLLTPIAGGVDTAFSVGCAIKMDAVSAAEKFLICKWDDQTPLREWRLFFDVTEDISFQIADNSVVNARRGRSYDTALVIDTWYIVIATYDGVGGPDPEAGMNIYLYTDGVGWNGVVDDIDDNGGGGPYVDMEDTAQPVMIGAGDTAGGPVPDEFWPGEMMMPFMTRRDLSEADIFGVSGAERVARQMVRIMEL